MNRIVDWKKIIPPKNVVRANLDFYKSDVSLTEFDNKTYVDDYYALPLVKSSVNHARLYGDWVVKTYFEDDFIILRLTDDKSGQYIELAFNSLNDQLTFIKEVYSNKNFKFDKSDIDLENIKKNKENKNKSLSTLGMISGLGLLYYLFKSNRNK